MLAQARAQAGGSGPLALPDPVSHLLLPGWSEERVHRLLQALLSRAPLLLQVTHDPSR